MRSNAAVASERPTQKARHLHAVPKRQVERSEYVPPGRALHLVDVENLMGGPTAGADQLVESLESYRVAAPFSVGDHAVVAANPAIAIETKFVWPEARLLARGGPDGADMALLGAVVDVEFVAERYDTIVVGSGDGVFEVVANAYRPLGLAVGVVARRVSLSYGLASAASFVRFLPEEQEETVAV